MRGVQIQKREDLGRLLRLKGVRRKQEQGSHECEQFGCPVAGSFLRLRSQKGREISEFSAKFFACLSVSLPFFFHTLYKQLSPTSSRGDSYGVGILYLPHH